MGKFDQIIGMYQAQAKLLAYELIATRKTIFPELWAVSHPNAPSSARIVRLADGKKGTIGIIENGTIIPVNVQPGQMTGQAIDRLERNARVEGGIPSDWGGESATNIRTAKRGAQVTSSSVDPTLGELQTIVAEAREAEVARAIAVMKGWYGGTTTSFYIPRNGKPVSRDYRPNDLFKTDLCIAKFSMPGVDAASIPIEIGQRTGTGEMSMDTARRMDPMVEDPEHERDQVELEGLRLALLKGLEQQAATGALDPQEVALIAQLKRGGDGLEFEECVIKAHDIIQKQQAAAQGAAGGLAAPPEQQPGLGQAPPRLPRARRDPRPWLSSLPASASPPSSLALSRPWALPAPRRRPLPEPRPDAARQGSQPGRQPDRPPQSQGLHHADGPGPGIREADCPTAEHEDRPSGRPSGRSPGPHRRRRRRARALADPAPDAPR